MPRYQVIPTIQSQEEKQKGSTAYCILEIKVSEQNLGTLAVSLRVQWAASSVLGKTNEDDDTRLRQSLHPVGFMKQSR